MTNKLLRLWLSDKHIDGVKSDNVTALREAHSAGLEAVILLQAQLNELIYGKMKIYLTYLLRKIKLLTSCYGRRLGCYEATNYFREELESGETKTNEKHIFSNKHGSMRTLTSLAIGTKLWQGGREASRAVFLCLFNRKSSNICSSSFAQSQKFDFKWATLPWCSWTHMLK